MSAGDVSGFDPINHGHIIKVSPNVIGAFRAEPHSIDSLFDWLKLTNPDLSRFILARIEQLAPSDMPNKEVLARVALETLGVIEAQGEVTELNAQFSNDIPEPNRPLAS